MKYDAFISYRHLPRDMYVAKGVHRALETTRIPKKIQELTGKKRIQRVFRDQDELPIGSNLSDNIEAALKESEYLVVICTPQTKESAWVMKEINTFISLRGRNRILAVLADGEPADSFPPQLLTDALGNPREPLAADVRGLSKKEISAKIRSESLRLAASILGVDYDDLKQRHKERMMKRYTAIAAAFAVAGIAFGVYNAYNLNRINENYRQKLVNESRVLAKTSAEVLKEGDRKTAALIAMEGLPRAGDDRPLVPDAMYALSNSLGCYELGSDVSADVLLAHKSSVSGSSCNTEGTYLASYDNYNNYYIWDVLTGKLLVEGTTDYNNVTRDRIYGVGMTGDLACFVTEKGIIGINTKGEVVYKVSYDSACFNCAFDGGYSTVLVNLTDAAVLYDTRTGELQRKIYNAHEAMFDDTVAFSEDLTKLALTRNESNVVTSYDLTGKTATADYEVWGSAVIGIGYTYDGGLVVASIKETGYRYDLTTHMMVQRFDEGSSLPVFEKEYIYENGETDVECKHVVSRRFSDAEGSYEQLLFVAGMAVYNLNPHSGELINKYIVPDKAISAFLYGTKSHDACVCSKSGNVYWINATTDQTSKEPSFYAGKSVTSMAIKSGRVIVTGSALPDIRILTERTDPTVEDFEKPEIGSACTFKSPEEKTYVYSVAPSGNDYVNVNIYDSATDKKIDYFTATDVKYNDVFYLDEDTLVATSSDGRLYFYHISTGELKEEQVDIGNAIESYAISDASAGNKCEIIFDTENFVTIDITNKKKLMERHLEDEGGYLEKAIVLDDGRVFFNRSNGSFYSAEENSEDITLVLEGCHIEDIKGGKDGKSVLLSCGDGKLRVYDADKKEVVEEIEFYATTSLKFIDMSKDGTKIFMQGDDDCFKIYDRKTHDFVYELDSQVQMVSEVNEDLEENRIAVFSFNYMYLIDLDYYGVIGRFYKGVVYLPKEDKAILYVDDTLKRVQIRSCEELIQEAKDQFGEDAALTPAQRRRYNIG